MQVTSILSNLAQVTRVTAPLASYSSYAQSLAATPSSNDPGRQRTIEQVAALGAALADVENLLRSSSASLTQMLAAAYSGASLDLSVESSATTLRSAEEINTTPTSFTPFGPSFDGASTAEATIGGVYDGDQGTDTLTFEVTRAGTHGSDHVWLELSDSNGDAIETIKINKNDPIDRVYTLMNGLTLELGAGDIALGDTFQVSVSNSVGTAVDPDKPFNGSRNEDPAFEAGYTVTAGAFEVNDVSIAVLADDTINSVIDRINASGAGVVAAFDSASERVKFTQIEPGSAYDVVLSNDTSGFLAATKLDVAASTPGLDADALTPLAATAAFGGVGSGTITVNGVGIAIDATTDSLAGILTRIDESVAGVNARLVSQGLRVRIDSEDPGVALELDDGGTGFFEAVGITARTYVGQSNDTGLSRARSYQVSDAVEHFAAVLNDLFDDAVLSTVADSSLAQLRTDIGVSAASFFPEAGGNGQSRTGFGLTFTLGGAAHTGNFIELDRPSLNAASQRSVESVSSFFLSGTNRAGLVASLSSIANGYLLQYGSGTLAPGGIVDLVA